jgi:hypothetical protein
MKGATREGGFFVKFHNFLELLQNLLDGLLRNWLEIIIYANV